MKTLRRDLWDAYEKLSELWSSEKILSELIGQLGPDRLREFLEDAIHVWDLHDHFRDYEEFAEEEE